MRARSVPRGFTLVELMVVVATIGILATVAIPSYSRIMLRVREAERTLHFADFKKQIVAHWRTTGKVPECFPSGWNPAPYNPAPKPQAFKKNMDSCWKQIPWSMDGKTMFTWYYGSWWATAPNGRPRQQFYIYSLGDLDRDGISSYIYLICMPDEMQDCLGNWYSYEGRCTYPSPDPDELNYYPCTSKTWP
jgi:prepilin-type N-terminal cleavage/methylation domain-containing protein